MRISMSFAEMTGRRTLDIFRKRVMKRQKSENTFHLTHIMSLQSSDFEEVVKVFPFEDTPSNPAYVYTGVIFECLGQERLVTDLWNYASNKFPEQSEQAVMARRLREGLLKANVLVGFPRVRLFRCFRKPSY
jgi:hypothetical protein